MTETPDFEQLARSVLAPVLLLSKGRKDVMIPADQGERLVNVEAAQFRVIWDARQAEVTALRAALEQAVKTCSQCDDTTRYLDRDRPQCGCRQCDPWRALLGETPKEEHA